MAVSIFEFTDYKAYINATLEANSKKRGGRSELARSIHCQPGYVSRVLGGSIHFSLEQADSVNQFFGHSEDESQYLLLLVEWNRAGSTHLKAHLEKQISRFQKDYLNLKNRLKIENRLEEKDQTRYFSSWHYAAIHTLLSIPQFQNKERISKQLHIRLNRVSQVIDYLVRTGLIAFDGKKYSTGVSRLHLGNDSPLISKHHINWRIQAIKTLEHEDLDDLHYSSVVSLSNADVQTIKSILIKSVEAAKAVIKDSKEETVACFNVDFFLLK
ncbi:MAG: hypothetical protein A2X94_10780 [Bdellovibrionales bacterium GWB1_55_8]|nr:MAG: hypothetical protein A2X94_10780 [Bdellovibrionales bacterium GWB1_55_8]